MLEGYVNVPGAFDCSCLHSLHYVRTRTDVHSAALVHAIWWDPTCTMIYGCVSSFILAQQPMMGNAHACNCGYEHYVESQLPM